MAEFIAGQDGLEELRDGMADPVVGGAALTKRRRDALQALLTLMDCQHPRGVNCDHIDALQDLADVFTATLAVTVRAGINGLPRPLEMRAIDQMLGNMRAVSLLPAREEHRHGGQ